MQFEKKKNGFPTGRPVPERMGRVRGNKNIFKVGIIKSQIFCAAMGQLIRIFIPT